MELHERSAFVVPPLDVTFDWRGDIERFGRELAMAEERGTGDSLSLAEMECSLDLIDAELLGLRDRDRGRSTAQIRDLTGLRGKLAHFITRMKRITPE